MKTLHVVFNVGGAEYVLPAGEVVQMESFTGATAVPGSPPYVAGLVQVRGKVLPVIDLRARFGVGHAETTFHSRLVVGQRGDRSVALLVDSAREVLKIDEEEMQPPPPMVAERAAGFVTGVVRRDGRLLMRIDFAKVIGEEPLHGDTVG